MKRNHAISQLLLAFALGFMVMNSAQAVNETFLTDVVSITTKNRTGKNPVVFVNLSDTGLTFTDMKFKLPFESSKEMMATLLTAVTMGFQVEIVVDLSSAATPFIKRLSLVTP